MPDFGSPEFWDDFYQKKLKQAMVFEWLQDPVVLKEHLMPGLTSDSVVCDIGCGLSKVGELLYDAGVKTVYCIDTCYACILKLKERNTVAVADQSAPGLGVGTNSGGDQGDTNHRGRVGGHNSTSSSAAGGGGGGGGGKCRKRTRNRRKIIYSTMDCTQLDFGDNSLDLIVDKGTLDTLLATKGDHDQERGRALVTEAWRTLRPGGRYVCCSHSHEHVRRSVVECAPLESTGFTRKKDDSRLWSWSSVEVFKVSKRETLALLYTPSCDESHFHSIFVCTK